MTTPFVPHTLHPAALDMMESQADLERHWVPISPKDLRSLIAEVRKWRERGPKLERVAKEAHGVTEIGYDQCEALDAALADLNTQ